MQTDVAPASTNVVRFPVERRAQPTLELMRKLASNAREVPAVLNAFDVPEPPPHLRRRADAAMAARILGRGIGHVPMAPAALDRLIDPIVTEATAACRSARDLLAAASRQAGSPSKRAPASRLFGPQGNLTWQSPN